MKAKAMVLMEPGHMEMRKFDVVEPRPDQILVRIGATSVCASDPKILRGETPFKFYPIIMGHELAGTVVEIGAEASISYGLKVGQKIAIEPTIPCGRCQWCRTQYYYHRCRPLKAYGISMLADQPPYLFGGYAD